MKVIILAVSIIILFQLYKVGYISYFFSNYKKFSSKPFIFLLSDKGAYGEYLLFKRLERKFPNMKILANIYLNTGNGNTTEIDLIGINKNGIFSFEVKNYKGAIYGDGNNKNWAQFLGKNKYNFYNPISQNQTHINVLQRTLNFRSKEAFKSMIVFSDNCEIKKVKNVPNNVCISQIKNVHKEIKKEKSRYFTRQDINRIYNFLYQFSNVNSSVKKRHIKNIKNKYGKN
jgi:hypothetical protein